MHGICENCSSAQDRLSIPIFNNNMHDLYMYLDSDSEGHDAVQPEFCPVSARRTLDESECEMESPAGAAASGTRPRRGDAGR
jgi:hypothetical protein